MTHPLRVLPAALAAALVLGLAACGDDDPEPTFAPPAKTTSAAPTSPTTGDASEPPERPEAVVRAWVKAQNTALRSGRTEDLRAFSDDSCDSCEDFIAPIEDVYAKGGYFQTRGWTVEAAKAKDLSASPVVVDVGITIAGGQTVASKGAEPVGYEEDKRILEFRLTPMDHTWRVTFIGFLS